MNIGLPMTTWHFRTLSLLPWTLQAKLALIIAAAFTPILGLTIYSAWDRWRDNSFQAEQQVRSMVSKALADQNRLIERADNLLFSLASSAEFRKRKTGQCNGLLAGVLKTATVYANLIAVNLSGNIICSALHAAVPVNYSDRLWFKQAVETRNSFIGEYLIGRLARSASLTLSHPVVGDRGKVKAVVAASLNFNWLEGLLKDLGSPEGTVATVIDSKGAVLIRYPEPEKWVGKAAAEVPVIKTVLQQRNGLTESVGLDGVRRFYAFAQLPGSPVAGQAYVIFGIPKETVFAETNRDLLRDISTITLIGLLTLFTVWQVGNRLIVRPVARLVNSANRLGAGDMTARTELPQRTGELGQLSRAFDEMAEALEKRAGELSQAEEKFRTIAETAKDAIVSADTDGNIIYVNQAAESLFGYSANEIIGEPLTLLIPESLRDTHLQGFLRFVQTQEPRLIGKTVEVVGKKKNGLDIPVEVSLTSWKVGQETFFTGIIRDITDRKQAERRNQQHIIELATLSEIDRAISSSLELRSVFGLLFERISAMLPYSAARIRLINKQSGELEQAASWSKEENHWEAEPWNSGLGTGKRALESRMPVIVRNVFTDARLKNAEAFSRYGLFSTVAIPLLAGGEPLGVISFYTKDEHQFGDEELHFLSTLAGQVAVAINNSKLYEQTKKQAADLEKANKIKSEFLSVMSHELRTPLTAIVGYTGMIKDGMCGEINPQQENFLGKVLVRSQDLLEMINYILQATSLEAGETRVAAGQVDLSRFFNELKAAHDFPIKKEVTLQWKIPPDIPPIHTDGLKLRHVVQNLINNAIKFTEKGSVTISARIAESRTQKASLPTGAERCVEFKVADTGIGIPGDSLPMIFEAFRQVDSSETRLYGGVGLGLYIVKKYTELLGGTVEVESELGKGSTFTVRVPC
ncbi:MAG: PAS domain S-box protein [Deltaproteobacteria bacterium]|nr:PAS domain S-box protein [Deltaproteobacteria bacterium]